MSIIGNPERIGRFTSSEIWKLMQMDRSGNDFGQKALTYIDEKKIETRMGRSITIESYSQAMAWGIFMEMYVFSMIGVEYIITSNTTDMHPSINCWSGSKDLIVEGHKVSDIKCYQPKKFAQYTDVIISRDLEKMKKDFKEEYWQLVSNAIINQVPNAEAITFMPYESELEEIRDMAENYDGPDQWKYRFIAEKDKDGLPYLPDGGYYKNLNKFEFEVPKDDIELLTDRVKQAQQILTSK